MPATTTEETIERLKQELKEAEVELADLTEEATHPPEVELGGGSPGYSTWQTAVVMKQHIENHIEELRDAISRAEQGLYGICESCGKKIAPERLEALPFTTLCIECASKATTR
jgi:RNA polymerase-binding transcription factor DksA